MRFFKNNFFFFFFLKTAAASVCAWGLNNHLLRLFGCKKGGSRPKSTLFLPHTPSSPPGADLSISRTPKKGELAVCGGRNPCITTQVEFKSRGVCKSHSGPPQTPPDQGQVEVTRSGVKDSAQRWGTRVAGLELCKFESHLPLGANGAQRGRGSPPIGDDDRGAQVVRQGRTGPRGGGCAGVGAGMPRAQSAAR